MSETETCGAAVIVLGVARCQCGLPPHPADIPHECAERVTCNGAWLGDGVTMHDFTPVRYPLGSTVD